MAVAYTPGLAVKHSAILRKERKLPIKGEVLVKVGDTVQHDTVVARTDLPGAVRPLNVANLLGIPPGEIGDAMKFKEGDSINEGDVLASVKTFFGWFTSSTESPISGTVENVSTITGQVLLRMPPIPVEISAYVGGKVVEVLPEEGVVIETSGAFMQGIFGVGGETHGEIAIAVDNHAETLTAEHFKPEHAEKIVVGGDYVSYEALQRAKELGVAGIVVGGFDDSDLKKLLGIDLGVAITGREELGFSLVVSEGFGPIPMARQTFKLLKELEGEHASMNGATQIRAGVIRPEIFVQRSIALEQQDASGDAGMHIGSLVRIIRQPHFGESGVVEELPHELQQVQSETKVRVVQVRLDDGTSHTLPRANVEIIAIDEE